MKSVFWMSIGLLAYTYVGYHLLLRVIASFLPTRQRNPIDEQARDALTVSVILACYNEEGVIRQRIENLLQLDYPKNRLEIVIASDGSTDRTAEMAEDYESGGIRVLRLTRGGRASAHNSCIEESRGEILIFTDADTKFDANFVRKVVGCFQNEERIGCVVGNLKWKTSVVTGASRLRELSWRLETDLKRIESRLGILASGCGAAMAVRKQLWKPMTDAIDDVDSVTPLDVIRSGSRVVFAEDAIAYDMPFTSARNDFGSKVRGVSKSIVMIPRRWKTTEWIAHPWILSRTLSHHFFRWVGSYFILGTLVSSLFIRSEGAIYEGIILVEIVLALAVVVGAMADWKKKRIAIASEVFSFAVVNAGFALGTLKGIVGKARGPYETV
jgi:cellulose synthase/poly-beta-1,6-N-acetylglucosamine synthase-like glycosyltransferase